MPTRRLFVGASGAVGYDYRREGIDGFPYPVLEDLTGALVCYDEILFLSRYLCPRDMWELPYVRFLDEAGEDVDLDRLRTAADQFRAYLVQRSTPSPWAGGSQDDIVERIVGGDRAGIDNHSREIRIGDTGWTVMANAGDLELLVGDMGVAAALELPDLDVLSNTIGTQRFVAQTAYDGTFLGDGFGAWHLQVANNLAAIRVPNSYAPGSTYVPEIEELREHPNLKAFRKMLSESPTDERGAAEAAAEISNTADEFARRQLSKTFKRRPWYYTISRLAVGPVGNLIHPGLGNAANKGIKVVEYVGQRDERKIGGWAAFVVDLHASR